MRREPRLRLRARADRRVAIGVIVGGALFDIAGRGRVASVSATIWIMAVAAAVLLSGRVRGRTGRVCLASAPMLGILLTFRTSPWVTIPAIAAVTGLFLLGASFGADGGGSGATFPALWVRGGLAVAHLALAPGMMPLSGHRGTTKAAGRPAITSTTVALLVGLPVLLAVAVLLAAADPIFRSWFSLAAVPRHLILVAAGAWIVAGLIRAASAERPMPAMPAAPSAGVAGCAFVLAGLCALYAAFACAQLVALSGAGHRILVTHGLTYATYARSGFFELLGCAAITLLVLVGARAFAGRSSRALTVLSAITIALTIVIVIAAIRRLELYEAAYGLTMLRLACLVAAAWIGLVFVLLGSTLPGRGLPSRAFPAAFIASGLVLIAGWGAANPASIVASTNLRRAEHGHALDVRQTASLGSDAVPAIVAGLNHLGPAAALLRAKVCRDLRQPNAGASFNVSTARSRDALASACGARGPRSW